MSKTKKSINRLLAVVLSVTIFVAMLPIYSVLAATTQEDFAAVTTFTGGTVNGNKTANVEVIVEETQLTWVEANDTRAEGWWVGIKVEAPEGFSADATYMRKSNPDAEYGEAISFATAKDGDNYIELWFAVSPESLNKFKSENRNLTMVYAFDWNADTTYEQEITFSVVPSEKIVLVKDDVQIYPADTSTVAVEGYEGVFDNQKHGVTVSAEGFTVKYSENNADFSEDPIEIFNVGEKTVYVALYKEGYKVHTETAKLVVTPADINDVAIGAPEKQKYDGKENQLFTIDGIQTGDTVIYSLNGEEDVTCKEADSAIILPTDTYIPGTYKVEVTVKRPNHNDYIQTVEYTIATGTLDITGVKVSGLDLIYTVDDEGNAIAQEAVKVESDGGYTLEYSLDGGEFSTDIPKVTEAGSYTVTVRATKQYYDNADVSVEKSETAEIPFNVYVDKAQITGVSTKAYGDNGETYDKEEHDIVAVIGTIEGDNVTYSKTGEDGTFGDMITVKDVLDSGTYYVKISRSANYHDLVIPVEVKIAQAELFIEFQDTDKQISYKDIDKNTFAYIIENVYGVDENNEKFEANDVEHTVLYHTESTGASIVADGTVTYTCLGDITVDARLDGEYANYVVTENTVDTYTVNIYNVDAPEFVVTGSDKYTSDGTDWYSGNVVITPSAGWEIVEVNGENTNGKTVHLGQTWNALLDKDAEGIYNNFKVAFRNTETNEITEVVDVTDFAIDKTNPVVTEFKIHEKTVLEKVVNFFTFGVFANNNVKVTVTVKDEEVSSGIKEIVLYANGESVGEVIKYGENNLTATFVVPKDQITENSRLDVILTAKTVDNVSRESDVQKITKENSNLADTDLMIENITPIIENVKFASAESVSSYTTSDNKIIFNSDFELSFDIDDKDSGLYSVDVDVNGNGYKDYPVNYVDEAGNKIADVPESFTVSTQDITSREDGSYEFTITVTDCAGNVKIDSFVAYKDLTAPIITDFVFGDEKTENLSDTVQVDTYGFWFKDSVNVSVTAKDLDVDNEFCSNLKSITVYLHDIDTDTYYTVYNANGTYYINDISDFGYVNTITFDTVEQSKTIKFTVPANFKGQIYAYATDNVNNSRDYVHPDGSVVENIDKHMDTSDISFKIPTAVDTQNDSFAFEYTGDAEEIDSQKDYNDNQLVPLYNSDIVFGLDVKDTYSGIRSVKWTIFEGEDPVGTAKEVIVKNDGTFDTESDVDNWVIAEKDNNLVCKITNEIKITGNHNNMVLLVELTDRAGNTSYDYYVFGIDTTAPVINVTYDDDVAKNDEVYTEYFSTNRTATIVITERNFRAENVSFEITNTDGAIPAIDLTDSSVWTKAVNTDNLDQTAYTAVINYTADGDYTFAISCVDNVGNKNVDVNYGDSIAPTDFTIDKILPTVKVEYDNNEALNGNYFKADRVATITIVEHNFDASRVEIVGVATDNGNAITFPAISGWKGEGDVHTTTITYNVDGKYSFDINFKDMASNAIVDFVAQEFYVDKTNPVVSISGIVDQSANNYEGNIGFTITSTDTNFDRFKPVLTAVVMADGKFTTTEISVGTIENVANGQRYTVNNLTTDGIYSITCTVIDKAGNAYSEVILENAEGNTYVEKRSGTDKLVTFSVNRNGSTFDIDSYTKELIESYYAQNVTQNVVIYEINADPIVESTVTLNGKTLVEGTDYTVSLSNSEGSWYKYSYNLDKSIFENESEYNIVISSKDKATNEAFSDIKDLTVKFVVDRTAPIVNVAGLKTNGRYQTDKQVVTLVPTDDGGSLKSLIVRTVDENGKLIKELINLSGDELAEAIANGNITFELGEGLYQNVQIICEDYAGNIIGAETDEIYSNVSISSSAFMIFWANKPLRWGSIVGVVLLTAAIIFLVISKKYKKKQEQK